MTIRIVRDQEVRDALAENRSINESRKEALNELRVLRDFVLRATPYIPVDHDLDPYLDPDYAYEVIGTIERCIEDWPIPITKEDLET